MTGGGIDAWDKISRMSQERWVYENNPTEFHLREKPADMNDELTLSCALRGIGGNSGLFRTGRNYGRELGGVTGELARGSGLMLPVVNVGDGLGFNSVGIRLAWQEMGVTNNLLGMDLSPRLLTAQRKENGSMGFTQANALSLPFPKESLAGLVVNEVVADFPVVVDRGGFLGRLMEKRVASGSLGSGDLVEWVQHRPELEEGVKEPLIRAMRLMEEYGVEPARTWNGVDNDGRAINVGVMEFLEEAARVVAPGGFVWMSEFGAMDSELSMNQVMLKGHCEWSIKFDQVVRVAAKLGFAWNYHDRLDEVLPLRREAWYLSRYRDGQRIWMEVEEALGNEPELKGKVLIPVENADTYGERNWELDRLRSLGVPIWQTSDLHISDIFGEDEWVPMYRLEKKAVAMKVLQLVKNG